MTEAQRAFLALTSRLLEYPDMELFDSIPGLRAEASMRLADDCLLNSLNAFLDYLESQGLAQARERYVSVFDLDPASSLYLAWHRYGNDRGQGRAMAALNGIYRAAGFEPLPGIMPDYLPRMLEFLSVCEDWAAEAMLDGFGPELAKLIEHLESLESSHAQLLSTALAPLKEAWPDHFLPRTKPDPTIRPMANPEPESGESFLRGL